jgi:phosphatidyl-myo-inositol dimannoside synthase
MRVLALVTDAYGGEGGIARAARDLLESITDVPGVESVRALVRRQPSAPQPLPAKLVQHCPAGGRIGYAFAALRHVLVARPTVVLCNHLYMAPLAVVAARLCGARCHVQLHGIEVWQPPSRPQRWAMECADRLLCVSRDTRAHALGQARLPPERAVVLNNTVGNDFTPQDRAAARRQFGVRDEFVLLTVGRMDPRERYKGHDRVIRALPALTNQSVAPPLYFIAGEGGDRPRLADLAAALGVSAHVRFLGHVPEAQLPSLYNAADLYVMPSTGEGFGIAFLEAMACGTPAAGLAVGGATDALADGELGVCAQEAVFALQLQATVARLPKGRSDVVLAAEVLRRFGRNGFRRAVARLYED